MKTPLYRYSMERAPQGNFDQMRLLDARLSLESMLVRETVQNAWDARSSDRGGKPVYFEIRGDSLEGRRAELLRLLLADAPRRGLPPSATQSGRSLVDVLAQQSIPILEVSDRWTLGLTGDPVSRLGESPDHQRFARFMLDMGRPPGSTVGGGTYGYGKTVLWRTSTCATVMAYSRYPDAGGSVRSRLMAAAMGDPYVEDGTERTGRHWWGIQDAEDNVLPLTGGYADEVATALGLWDPSDVRTGMTVLVIGSRFSSSDDILRLREAVRWHCWPKWAHVQGQRQMEFGFAAAETPLPGLDSREDPMIEPFASALGRVLDGDGEPCEVRRPAVTAGHVAWVLRSPREDAPLGVSNGEEASDVRPIQGELNHVALVRRGPRLHVRFEEFPGPPPDGTVRAGVFLTAEANRNIDEADGEIDVEGAFARAEPPTHDDWAWASMERGWDKTIVKTGLARLQEKLRGTIPIQQGAGDTELARIANVLGTMLDAGLGPSAPRPGPGAGGGRREVRIRERGSDLVTEDDQLYVRVHFDVAGRGMRPARLVPTVAILDGDGRSDPIEDLGERLWWGSQDEDFYVGSVLDLETDDPDEGWALWVPVERQRRLRVTIRVEVDEHG